VNRILALILFAAACIGSHVHANQISGRELLAFCTGSAGPESKAYCNGYITAAVETHATWSLWNRMERVFCFPKGDKFAYAFEVVVAYLKSHPEELDFEASSLVLNSLNQAFPCE